VGESDIARRAATPPRQLIYCGAVKLAGLRVRSGNAAPVFRQDAGSGAARRLAAALALALLSGCGGSSSAPRLVETSARSAEADPEATDVRPSYPRPELEQVISDERRAIAQAELELAALSEQRGQTVELALRTADLGVQRRYLAALEQCRDSGRWCPPRLGLRWTISDDADVPVALDATLRFDRDSWRALTTELWARGCDCRSMRCVDAMTQTIDALETRPTPEVQGDHDASVALTGARTCLWRLRGLAGSRALAPAAEL
jgi:hypothetical protein